MKRTVGFKETQGTFKRKHILLVKIGFLDLLEVFLELCLIKQKA